jgi:SMI1 / KNR4 family (SUKH-1)
MSEFNKVRELLDRLELHPGASPEELTRLQSQVPAAWPEEYLDCLRWSDGLEGYVGGRGYLWLWPTQDVGRLNSEYGVVELVPGLLLFGSDAAALGYGFDFASAEHPVVSVEMAAMHRAYLTPLASSFSAFVHALAQEPWPDGEPEPQDLGPPDWLRGKIIHEKHPIVLGGSPRDSANRVLMPRAEHPRVTVLFARILHKMREQGEGRG